MGCDDRKAIGAETFAGGERESTEIGEGTRYELEAFVRDGHALKPELPKPWIGPTRDQEPRVNFRPPVGRHEVEIREAGLPLEGYARYPGKPPNQDLRRDGITVSDEDLPAAPGLGSVPGLTYQRNRAPVLDRIHEQQHVLQHLVWE